MRNGGARECREDCKRQKKKRQDKYRMSRGTLTVCPCPMFFVVHVVTIYQAVDTDPNGRRKLPDTINRQRKKQNLKRTHIFYVKISNYSTK